MPPAYPREFREDVVRVARNREPGVRLADIAKDFAISESCSNNWLKDADVADGIKPGATSDERAENPRVEAAVAAARAGERGAAMRRGVSVSGELAEKMMFPLVRELAIDGIPVTVTCRVLKLCRQQYYRWMDEPFTAAELDEAWLANAIFDAHRDDPEFGYRFLADEVRLDGEVVSDRVVWRICRDNGWWSVFGKPKRAKGSKPGAPSHDDLVRRNFTAEAPNVVWLAAITEHWTDEGKLYCCAIKDLFSNRIVGWAIDSRMKARLVVAAIEMAVARRGGDVAGCILHSDRGSQFRSRKVHRTLAHHGLVGSMGKVGSAGDNAAMESFFALLQKNVLNRHRRWATRDQLRIEIVTWIERTYHQRRRQPALGRLTPVEYEMIMTPQTAHAA